MTRSKFRSPAVFALVALVGLSACAENAAYFAPKEVGSVHPMNDFTPFIPGK